MLEEVIEKAGHICLFLPKFHCELNPIEMLWGYVKRYIPPPFSLVFVLARLFFHRKIRKEAWGYYQLSEGLQTVLESVPVSTCRKFARMTMRYVQMYATGATGRLAEFAQKKYRGHRCLPESWWTELVDGYRAKYGQKAEFLEDMEALESRVEERDIFEEEEEEREEENPSAAEDPDAEWLAIEEE